MTKLESFDFEKEFGTNYFNIYKYCKKLVPTERKTLNRENEINSIRATLSRPEVSNAILLGAAGSGKTAIVNETARQETDRLYLQVDLSLMSSSDGLNGSGSVEMATRMKQLVNEVEEYQLETDVEIVLFMDEFHIIAQTSTAALQAIKPLLAESGVRKIKIIAATTLEEYDEFIRPDEALTERLQEIFVNEPGPETVEAILKSMKEKHAPTSYIDGNIYGEIIEATNKYLPSQSQPRKALLLFDALLGEHRTFHTKLDINLMNKILKKNYGIENSLRVDVRRLKKYLNARVIDQELATDVIINRLFISIAGLTDNDRPQGSFLFTGSTGVGKTEMAKALTSQLFGNSKAMIRFDMSEYAQDNSIDIFRERLSSEVWAQPFSTILLDEIEKSSPKVTRLLLQIIDDARLTDKHGRQVSFVNSYIIMTTNEAQEIFAAEEAYQSEDKAKKEKQIDRISSLIKENLTTSENFPTELINRLDSYIPFAPLKKSALQKIARLRLRELVNKVYEKHQVEIIFDKNVLIYLVEENAVGGTDAGGGRRIKRTLDNDVTGKIAEFIAFHPDEKTIGVNVEGIMASQEKYEIDSDAHIVVGARKLKREASK